jgi:hypothetical protein
MSSLSEGRKGSQVSETGGKGKERAVPKVFPFRRSAAPIDFGSQMWQQEAWVFNIRV